MRSLDFVLGMEGGGSREPWKSLEAGEDLVRARAKNWRNETGSQ